MRTAITALISLLLISSVSAQDKYPSPWLDKQEYSWTEHEIANSPTLSDISQHSPPGYTDSDPITSGHEQTHGTCSKYRNQQSVNGLTNAFYLLNGRVEIITAPKTTLAEVAKVVPQELQGDIFNLYVRQQQRYWNNEPMYLAEEMVCYKHGSMIRFELGITKRGETVAYALEMMVYSLYMMHLGEGPNQKLEQFMAEQIWAIADTYHNNKKIGGLHKADAYLERMRNNKQIYQYIDELTNKYPKDSFK